MQNLFHFHHREPKHFQFGESRTVNLVGASALKGMMDGAMGDDKGSHDKGSHDKGSKEGAGKKGVAEGPGKGAVENTGKFMRAVNWLTTADSTFGYMTKWPLVLTRKAVEATIGTYKVVDGSAVAVGQKLGDAFIRPIKEKGEAAVKLGGEVSSETVKLSSNLVLNPALEIAKANFVEFPKRAIVDQFQSGLKVAFGVPGVFVDRSITAVKKTLLSPITLVLSCRNALKEVLWNTPKNLYDFKFKEAGKSLLKGPYEVMKGVLDAPMAIAAVPYHTAMEASLGGLEMAMNGTRAMVAPIEGLVNSLRSMSKSMSFIEFIKKKAGVDHVKTYRQRLGDLFKFQSPVAAMAT